MAETLTIPNSDLENSDFERSSSGAILEVTKLVSLALQHSTASTVYDTLSGIPLLAAHEVKDAPKSDPIEDPGFIASCRRYMKFATATFGWRLVQGLHGERDSLTAVKDWLKGMKEAVGDSESNHQLLLEYTGIEPEDILAESWSTMDILRPAHFIAIDRKTQSIVIAIRGTMSLKDALTDLAATPIPILDGYAHHGIAEASRVLAEQYRPLLRKAFAENQDLKRVVVTGHSLGGGTATIVALLLQDEFPIRGYAFAPPPVLSPALALRCSSFIYSIAFRNDIVTRLSVSNLYELRDRALAATKEDRESFWSGWKSPLLQFARGTRDLLLDLVGHPGRTTGPSTTLPERLEDRKDYDSLDAIGPGSSQQYMSSVKPAPVAETLTEAASSVQSQPAVSSLTGGFSIRLGKPDTIHMDENIAPPFKTAGRVFWISQEKEAAGTAQIFEVEADMLSRIVLSTSMLMDHMPAEYERSLDSLCSRVAPHIPLKRYVTRGIRSTMTSLADDDSVTYNDPPLVM